MRALTRPAHLIALVVAVLAVLVGASAPVQASGSDDSTPPGKAWVRAGQFASGLGAVQVQLTPRTGAGMTLAQSVSYGRVSTYRQVEPGSYTISVRPQDADPSSQPMLRRSLTVVSGKASTVAVLGTSSAPRLATLGDDLTPPSPGTARVRVLSGSTVAPDVSVTAVGGPTIATGVVLGQTTDYGSVPEGPWTLALVSGSGARAKQTVRLASGGVYTAVVLDTAAKKVRLSLVTDAQGAAQAPQGGAATGLGGTAVPTTSSRADAPGAPAVLLVVVAGLLGAGAALTRRRASVRSSAR